MSDRASSSTVPRFGRDSTRVVAAPAQALFQHLDDHNRMVGHMGTSSWMMAGSTMAITLEAAGGRQVGSLISLQARVPGIPIHVEEVVTIHEPPLRKVWKTMNIPEPLVIGPYVMGFEITPQGLTSLLRVFIRCELPAPLLTRLLARLFSGFHARWCTDRIADDGIKAFEFATEKALGNAGRQ